MPSTTTAMGAHAMSGNTFGWLSGDRNTAVGERALLVHTSGDANVALGTMAGIELSSGSNNLYLASPGVSVESQTTRIGNSQTRAFVSGVRAAQTGVNDAVPVVIDSNGQLGTISSSRETKDNIANLGDISHSILRLRPVQFTYKEAFEGGTTPLQYGLIAEEVAEVLPELVALGKNGEIETVKYHVLPTLLLAEVQRLERERATLSDVVRV